MSDRISSDLDEILKCTNCFQEKAYLFNIKLKSRLRDESGVGPCDNAETKKILDKTTELINEMKETTRLCEECKKIVGKLEIEVNVRIRDDRGRHHDQTADSGIGSNVYAENPSSGIQECTSHTYSQSLDVQQLNIQESNDQP